MLPWLLLVLFLVVLVRFRSRGLTYAMLIRVPVLFMLALLVGPFVLSGQGSELFWNLFVLESGFDLGVTVALIFPAFWVGVTATRAVWLRGHERFAATPPELAPKIGRGLYFAGKFVLPCIPSSLLIAKSKIHGTDWAIAFLVFVLFLGAYESIRRGVRFLRERISASRSPSSPPFLPARLLAKLGPAGKAGYLDENGRLLREHIEMSGVFASFLLIYFAGYWLWGPRADGGFHLPVLGYVLLLLTWLIALLSGMTFFFDRFRVPLLGGLILWVYLAHSAQETDHYFPVRKNPTPQSSLPIARESFETWRKGTSKRRPVLIVCAEGGGIQAASWTAEVMTGLHEMYGRSFLDSLRMVSGVSGGSVGLMYFLHGMQVGADRKAILDATNASSLSSVGWGLVYPDFLRLLSPLDIFEKDRGWALEQRWRSRLRSLGESEGAVALAKEKASPPPTLSAWVEGTRSGALPAISLNSTVVETGEQFLFKTFRFWPQEREQLGDQIDVRDFFESFPGHDIDIVSAARLSATFPYVTPAARARLEGGENGPDSSNHLVDGGYFDNLGVTAAALWLWSCFATPYVKAGSPLDWQIDDQAFRDCGPVIFLLIRSFPEGQDEEPSGSGFSAAFLGPIKTLLSTRTTGQFSRNRRELEALRLVARSSKTLDDVHVLEIRPPVRKDADVPLSLSWHLTRDQIEQNDNDWKAIEGQIRSSLLHEALSRD